MRSPFPSFSRSGLRTKAPHEEDAGEPAAVTWHCPEFQPCHPAAMRALHRPLLQILFGSTLERFLAPETVSFWLGADGTLANLAHTLKGAPSFASRPFAG